MIATQRELHRRRLDQRRRSRTSIRPTPATCVGQYRAGRAPRDAERAIAAAKTRSRPGRARTPPAAPRHPQAHRRRDPRRARTSSGALLSREEGKTAGRGHRRDRARRRRSSCSSPASALRLAGEKLASVRPGRRRRDHARAGRRRRPDHAVEFPDRDSGLEDRAGARLRQLRRVQAGRAGAGDCARACPRSSRAPALPPGVFNLVMGRGSVVGEAMLEHHGRRRRSRSPARSPTGRRVAATCIGADPMKKVQLEMGGKNPLVVLDDADLDVAVECAVNGAFFSTGQRCTASLAADRHRRHPRPLRRRR